MAKAYIKDAGLIICANEGTGDNLLPEDVEEGYVDYVNYTTYEIDDDGITEADGGMVLLKEYVRDRYKEDMDMIVDVVTDYLGDTDHDIVLL